MSPIDFSGGPGNMRVTDSVRIIATAPSAPTDTRGCVELASRAITPLASLRRLLDAVADEVCPVHDVSPLVTRYVSAIAATPPDYHDAHPLKWSERLTSDECNRFKRLSHVPEVNETITREFTGEEMRCLCPEGTIQPPTLFTDLRVASGCIVRPAFHVDGIEPSTWKPLDMSHHLRLLDPALDSLRRMIKSLPSSERDALEKDIQALLDTLVGRARWDTRAGWNQSSVEWSSRYQYGAAADALVGILRRNEFATLVRKSIEPDHALV